MKAWTAASEANTSGTAPAVSVRAAEARNVPTRLNAVAACPAKRAEARSWLFAAPLLCLACAARERHRDVAEEITRLAAAVRGPRHAHHVPHIEKRVVGRFGIARILLRRNAVADARGDEAGRARAARQTADLVLCAAVPVATPRAGRDS